MKDTTVYADLRAALTTARLPADTSPAAAIKRLASLLSDVERERDAARKDAEELRLTLLAEQERAKGASLHHPERLLAEVNAERIRRNLSWRELATQLSVAPSTLTRWNHGHLPSIGVFFDAYDWLRAMQAADRSMFEARRAACIKRTQQLQSQSVILWPPNGAHQQTPAVMLERLTDPDLTEAVLAVYEAML